MKQVVAAGLMLASVVAWAQPQTGTAAPAFYAPPAPLSPEHIVRQGVDRLTGYLIGVPDASPEAIRAFLDREIAPYFDFGYMARWAAGTHHRKLNPEQRAAFILQLKELFMSALARNLGSYSRPVPRVDILPPRFGRHGTQATVNARIMSAQGLMTRLAFRFYWSDRGGWRIFDVSANGASAVAFYRGYFGDLIRRSGPGGFLRGSAD